MMRCMVKSETKPHVSIGLPVYNGERYLKDTLDSILTQTFKDFELIISDNASNDSTELICRDYSAKDSRVRYYRNSKNLGAPNNFNRTVELSSGLYFKWAAYDDLIEPSFLEKAVSILDNDPTVILCHCKILVIDQNSKVIGNCDDRALTKIASVKPHERFSDLISIRNPCWSIFGVMRADLLRLTPLHGDYIGADRNLLAELGLMGKIYEIQEYLFLRRDHPESYTRRFCEKRFAIDVKNYDTQAAWWSKDKFTNFPNWKDLSEFIRSIKRVKLGPKEKMLCYLQLFHWFFSEGWKFLWGDIENMLLRRSIIARKLIPFVYLNLDRTVFSLIRKFR